MLLSFCSFFPYWPKPLNSVFLDHVKLLLTLKCTGISQKKKSLCLPMLIFVDWCDLIRFDSMVADIMRWMFDVRGFSLWWNSYKRLRGMGTLYKCVCVCVSAYEWISLSLCVCVCVCVRVYLCASPLPISFNGPKGILHKKNKGGFIWRKRGGFHWASACRLFKRLLWTEAWLACCVVLRGKRREERDRERGGERRREMVISSPLFGVEAELVSNKRDEACWTCGSVTSTERWPSLHFLPPCLGRSNSCHVLSLWTAAANYVPPNAAPPKHCCYTPAWCQLVCFKQTYAPPFVSD